MGAEAGPRQQDPQTVAPPGRDDSNTLILQPGFISSPRRRLHLRHEEFVALVLQLAAHDARTQGHGRDAPIWQECGNGRLGLGLPRTSRPRPELTWSPQAAIFPCEEGAPARLGRRLVGLAAPLARCPQRPGGRASPAAVPCVRNAALVGTLAPGSSLASYAVPPGGARSLLPSTWS